MGEVATGLSLKGFEPESVQQAFELASVLSRSGLIPRALQGKPSDVLIILLTGRELGISSMQAIRGMHVIEGKVAMSADMMVALAVRSEVCEYFRLVSNTDDEATYETKRKGAAPVTFSFTKADAERAKLLTKAGPWITYRRAMFRARAASGLARAVYPDLMLGIYDSDSGELEAPSPPPSGDLVRVEAQPPPGTEPVVAEVVGAKPATGKRTAEAKAQLAAKTAKLPALIDVQEGETEQQAETRAAEAQTPYARIVLLLSAAGITGADAGKTIKNATGKLSSAALTDDDVVLVEATIGAERALSKAGGR
jgi:hypothetical protein